MFIDQPQLVTLQQVVVTAVGGGQCRAERSQVNVLHGLVIAVIRLGGFGRILPGQLTDEIFQGIAVHEPGVLSLPVHPLILADDRHGVGAQIQFIFNSAAADGHHPLRGEGPRTLSGRLFHFTSLQTIQKLHQLPHLVIQKPAAVLVISVHRQLCPVHILHCQIFRPVVGMGRRICRTHKDDHDAHHDGNDGHPRPGFFPVQGVLDAPLYPALPKGQRAGGRESPVGGKGQQGGAVGLSDVVPGGQHLFVAAHFHIPAHEVVGQPHQRIEPVHRQNEEGQGAHDMVKTLQMVPLMGQHVALLVGGQPKGQVDLRPHETQNKGRLHPVGVPDVLPCQHGGIHAAAQAHVADDAVDQQGRQTDKPDDGGHLQPVDRHRRRGLRRRRRIDRIGKGIVRIEINVNGRRVSGRYRVEITGRHRGHRARIFLYHLCFLHGSDKPEQAEKGLKAHRAHQTEGRHAPQGVGVFSGRFPQTQTDEQHHRDDHRGHPAHL